MTTMTFPGWMKTVNEMLVRKCGMTADELSAEMSYRDMYDCGASPAAAVRKALQNVPKIVCPCGDPNCPHPGDCDAMDNDDEREPSSDATPYAEYPGDFGGTFDGFNVSSDADSGL